MIDINKGDLKQYRHRVDGAGTLFAQGNSLLDTAGLIHSAGTLDISAQAPLIPNRACFFIPPQPVAPKPPRDTLKICTPLITTPKGKPPQTA